MTVYVNADAALLGGLIADCRNEDLPFTWLRELRTAVASGEITDREAVDAAVRVAVESPGYPPELDDLPEWATLPRPNGEGPSWGRSPCRWCSPGRRATSCTPGSNWERCMRRTA